MKIVMLLSITSAALLEASRTVVGVGGKGEGSLAHQVDQGVVLQQIMDYNKVLLEQVSMLKQQLADLKDAANADQENDVEEKDVEENDLEEDAVDNSATTATFTMHSVIVYPLAGWNRGLQGSSKVFLTQSGLTSSIITTINNNAFLTTMNCGATVHELCSFGNNIAACHELVDPYTMGYAGSVSDFTVRCATITCSSWGGAAARAATALDRFQSFQSEFSDKLLRALPAGTPFTIKLADQCANIQQAEAAFH